MTGLFDNEKPDMEEEEDSGQQACAGAVGVYLPVGVLVGIRHGGKQASSYKSHGNGKVYFKTLQVITHSGATPELGLCEDTGSWPRSCLHLPGHVLDRDTAFLMGR